jgi:hypothetical protein
MKQLCLLTLLLITTSLFAQNTSTNNFYPNGDFEDGLTGFNTSSAANLSAAIETTEVNPYTGSTKSVKLISGNLTSATQAGSFKPTAFSQLSGVDEGNYRFSFWVKSAVADQILQAQFVAENTGGNTFVKTNIMKFTDTDWHKVSFARSNVPGDKAVQFRILFIGPDAANQTFYIDDLNVCFCPLDTDMELSYNDTFRGTPVVVNVPQSGLDALNWASTNADGTNQVASYGYSDSEKYEGRRSLKVTTNATTNATKKGIINSKDNSTKEIRFETPELPTVGGSSDVTNYPEIKYTFSMKVRSNVPNAEINVNYKIGGVNKFGNLTKLDQNVWKTFTISHIVPRQTITGKTNWVHLPTLQMNTANADYYFDDMNISWVEWNSTTAGINDVESTPILVYPNPAKQFIMLDGINQTAIVDVFNITGQRVKSFSVETNGEQMDIRDLNPGVYFARVNDVKAIKFIKK